jgi:hypothetical protein
MLWKVITIAGSGSEAVDPVLPPIAVVNFHRDL